MNAADLVSGSRRCPSPKCLARLTLKPRAEAPHLCDVTASYAPPAQLGHKGPAKVATQAYREGWDEIFGAKPKDAGPAN